MTRRETLRWAVAAGCATALVGGCGATGGMAPGAPAGCAAPAAACETAAPDAPQPNTEAYDRIDENPFVDPHAQPLSTFAIDVDTASYANTRRFLLGGTLPPPDAVRIEEFVNYFRYDDAPPAGDEPFALTTELAACPWNTAHRIVRIGLAARRIDDEQVPPRNLVFLLDVSGSMRAADKLPLVQAGMKLLVDRLRPQDSAAIVVYAGASGVALPATPGADRGRIRAAIDELRAGGGTNGADGIRLAYEIARGSFREGGINRVILATDGDFNLGVTNRGELTRLIERERASGVFLTVLGVGSGNLKDAAMEELADRGNGNYHYLDSLSEARKVLVREAGGTLVTVAKDVKVQVEFNPARVGAYRLLGYENRLLAAEDFADDAKDGGEIGAGHTVTALYEIAPPGSEAARAAPTLRYQERRESAAADAADEVLTVHLRWKQPDGATSSELSRSVRDVDAAPIEQASESLRFAASVAAFGMLLRGSEHAGEWDVERTIALARAAVGPDADGDRAEFLVLARRARDLLDAREPNRGTR